MFGEDQRLEAINVKRGDDSLVRHAPADELGPLLLTPLPPVLPHELDGTFVSLATSSDERDPLERAVRLFDEEVGQLFGGLGRVLLRVDEGELLHLVGAGLNDSIVSVSLLRVHL